MDRWKSRGGKSQGGEVKKWEDQRRERVRSKKMQVREKVGKSRFTVFFPMVWGSGGSKSNLAKAAGAEPTPQMRDEKYARHCGAKHISKSKCTKHIILRPLLEVELSKKCAPLWRRGKKSRSKLTKHHSQTSFGSSTKCKLLWRGVHSQVKMYKAHHSQTTFGSSDVETVHAVAARSTFPSQESIVSKTDGFGTL